MRVAVLVKYVPDTEERRQLDPATGEIDRSEHGVIDEIDSRALSWALELRDSAGCEVFAVTMGPKNASDALRAALAVGANESVHILDDTLEGSDSVQTSAVLAKALQEIGAELVVAGVASTDGEVGALASMIAERLAVPHLTYLTHAHVTGTSVRGTRDGGSATYEVSAELPAVISVTEMIADPKVPTFRGIMSAKRKPRQTLELQDLALDPGSLGGRNAAWTVTSVAARPARTGGEVIIDEGDGARRIADFLAGQQLIGK